jgi:nitrous oxidase accessory protein NosD
MGQRLVVAALIFAGCASNPSAGEPLDFAEADLEDALSEETLDGPNPLPCPLGQQEGPDGACLVVGIQGCADLFIDPEDGLCKPSMAHCPTGQIPIFGIGCRPVGIPDCHEMFIDPEDGLCKPSMAACPLGQIPNFSEGCQAVGILDCHPDFIDPETGHCDPDPDLCGAGFIPVPTEGCVSLDPPGGCGSGTWGNVEELPGDIHVDPAYEGEDPDGSRDHPWTLIAYALGHVEAGGRIILAGGEYDEAVMLKKAIGLVGRCSSMVTLLGTKTFGAYEIAVRVLEAQGVTISDLTISSPGWGLDVAYGASLSLSRVALVDNQGFGIFVADPTTQLVADLLLIRGTQTFEDGSFGRGVTVLDGAKVILTRSALLENHDAGLSVESAGSEVSVEDVLVARTHGPGGRGLTNQSAGSLSLSRVAVIDNQDVGIFVAQAGSSLAVDQSVVLRTQSSPDGETGRGIDALLGAKLDLSRSALVGNHEAGMLIRGGGTAAIVEDSLVARTEPRPVGRRGFGVLVDQGASLTLYRSLLVENTHIGMLVSGEGSAVDAIDSLIAETRALDDGTRGRGVEVTKGAAVTLKRSALTGNRDIAFYITDEESQAVLEDSLIAETKMRGDGKNGMGLYAYYGSTVVIRRSAVVDNHDAGLSAGYPKVTMTVERSLVARTRPVEDGTSGRGIEVGQGATLWLSLSSVVDNPDFGVLAAAALGVSVTDVLIEGAPSTGATLYGDGLTVLTSIVNVRGLFSRKNARAGILFNYAQGVLEGSLAEDSFYGLVVQNQNESVLEIADDCLFLGNQENEEFSVSLDIPDEPMEIPEARNLD